ncbi:hypothetical protein A1343_09215 [Leptospira interrogans serovar Bataviae]|nr:hypothetical protein [Leptospira interrogans serovar Bataviae]OAM73890.1 hypothetical protein A1343_09215 [Leptospira interrogans serovar Bataviae]
MFLPIFSRNRYAAIRSLIDSFFLAECCILLNISRSSWSSKFTRAARYLNSYRENSCSYSENFRKDFLSLSVKDFEFPCLYQPI